MKILALLSLLIFQREEISFEIVKWILSTFAVKMENGKFPPDNRLDLNIFGRILDFSHNEVWQIYDAIASKNINKFPTWAEIMQILNFNFNGTSS